MIHFDMLRKVFTFTILAASVPAAAQESGIEVGIRAPAAAVQTLDGKPTNLSAYIGKRPVLMEFWAFWCPNCKQLEPSLLRLQKKYGSRVKFLAVAVSVNQTPARVKAYAAKHRYRHETVFDSDGKATDAYEVPATSYVVIVNAKGDVVYTGLGGKQDLEAALLKAF